MKKLIIIISLVMLQASSAFALTPMPRIPSPGTWTPPSMPCITNKITVTKGVVYPDFGIDYVAKVKNHLETYNDTTDYLSTSTGRYELCFEFVGFDLTGGALPVNEPLLFRKAVDSKSVYIKGLKLTRDSSFTAEENLLTITNYDTAPAASVVLEGIELTNVKYGLHISGDRIELINSAVTGEGVGSDTAGRENEACLLAHGRNQKVRHSSFSNCYAGIMLLEAENILIGAESETRFDAEANDIHDNRIGINYLSGQNNRFPFNRIYNNVKIAGTASSDDAIYFDPVLVALYEAVGLELPKRPEIVLLGSTTDAEQALHCDKDDTGRVIQRWIQFRPESISAGQEMIIYQTNITSENNQAERYFAKCTVNEDGKCIIVFPSSFIIDPSKCGLPDLYAVALMNDINYTSMITPRSFKLDGPVVALGTGPMIEIPDSAPGVTGGPPVTDLESSEEGSGSEFAGTGNAVEGGAPISSAGPGGGCMILIPAHRNTVGSALTFWWLIFAAPAALIAVKIKRKHGDRLK